MKKVGCAGVNELHGELASCGSDYWGCIKEHHWLRNLYPSSFCFHRGHESDTLEMNAEENLDCFIKADL